VGRKTFSSVQFLFQLVFFIDNNNNSNPRSLVADTRSSHNQSYNWQAVTQDSTEYAHTHLTALFPGLPGWAGTRKVNQSGFYWSKRQWVAVASAGPMQVCTSLQTGNHASTPPLSFYRPDALPATQPTASRHWMTALNNTAQITIYVETRCIQISTGNGH